MRTDKEEKQLEKIRVKLEDIKNFYEKILSIYSISDDLILEGSRDNAFKEILDNHLNNNQIKINELTETLKSEIKKIELAKNDVLIIDKFNNFLQETISDGTTTPRYKKLEAMLTDSNLYDLQMKSNEIDANYKQIFISDNPKLKAKSEELKGFIAELEEFHSLYFSGNSKEPSRYEEIQEMYDEIQERHEWIVKGYSKKGPDGKSIDHPALYDDFYNKNKELTDRMLVINNFYSKVFGNEERKESGLKQEIEDRLTQLKAVEEEAKKVISLSSDAGLAGGFLQKGEQARKNKYISLGVFVGALIIMGLCNFFTIEFDKLKEIDLVSLAVRLVINAPFIWIATVANISLNKYARLEEEYAHKESLAKSFERYKSEIEKISDTDNIKSKDLLAQLMKTNLQAFELNPAETMDKAKSDMPSFPTEQKNKKGDSAN